MEKRLNKQIETYLVGLKDDIRNKIAELQFTEKDKVNELIEYVYEYTRLSLAKDDVTKRKRTQNPIPMNNRCNAKRANSEQCTRRRKSGSEFCGTHIKLAPYGVIESSTICGECPISMEVVAKEIGGMVYYVDTYSNVYKTEDVLTEKQNPKIIGKIAKVNGAEIVEYSS